MAPVLEKFYLDFKKALFLVAFSFQFAPLMAVEPSAQVLVPVSAESSPSPVTPVSPSPRPIRNRGPVQKETEGTEASGRFDNDGVVKSPYKLKGEPLEVDPD